MTDIDRRALQHLIDVKFSHVGQCDPGDCDAQKEFFEVVERVDGQDAWYHKHLLDKFAVTDIDRRALQHLIDVKFSHVGQCDPGDCDAQKEFFEVVERVDGQDAWYHKHLLDKFAVTDIDRRALQHLIDVKFSHVGQCDPGDCDAQKEFFEVVERVDGQDAWYHKHLLTNSL